MAKTPTDQPSRGDGTPENTPREDRLKAALRENLARRKAQARARKKTHGASEED